MAISIKLNNLVKKYGEKTVIPNLSLEIEQGEFFTLLGPSGCGKTTLLRMIAGFNSVEGGEIFFNEDLINNKPAQHRNIGMVFQNYAIFPHLTVENNVAFGLKNRKISKNEINEKVDKILKTVQIENFKKSLPENLSGGQQQRVALARAIVVEPSVLLMDEPLSNLDSKLRIDLREAIRSIQQSVGITTVYVTHDQEEAMAVSDRIAVMKDGIIQHAGTPRNIYQRPANTFVASFIGRTNLLDRKLQVGEDGVSVKLDENYSLEIANLVESEVKNNLEVEVSIRPEDFSIASEGFGIKGEVIKSQFLGLNTHYVIKLRSGEEVEVIEESSIEGVHKQGETIWLVANKEKINVFNKVDHRNITSGVINDVKY